MWRSRLVQWMIASQERYPVSFRNHAMIATTSFAWFGFGLWYAANGRFAAAFISFAATAAGTTLRHAVLAAGESRIVYTYGRLNVVVNLVTLMAGAAVSGNEDSMFSWYILALPTLAAFQLGSSEAMWWGPPTVAALGLVRLQGLWFPLDREFKAEDWEVVGTQLVLGLLFYFLAFIVVAAYEDRVARLEASRVEVDRHARALEEARDQALAFGAARQLFIAHISHEVRTPLNGLIGMTELLLGGIADPQQRAMLGSLRRSGESLLSTLNQILDMAKLDAGGLMLEQLPTDVHQLLDDVIAVELPNAVPKGLQLHLEVASDVPARLLVDPTRLRQVVANLLGNAVKFTTDGGVVVRASWASARLRVEVEDTGPGIAEKDAERIFEPFSQADASTTRRYGGTGLGLTISRSIVRAMNGELAVRSAPSRGCVFSFEIDAPRYTTVEAEPVEPVAKALPTALRVLLADDNAVNGQVGMFVLRRLGIEVVIVTDGEQACQRASEEPFEVILMDLGMPVMDGLTATRWIRQNLPAHRQPWIIAVTAHAGADSRAECFAAGMDDVLVKPLRLETVQDALDRATQALAAREWDPRLGAARSWDGEPT